MFKYYMRNIYFFIKIISRNWYKLTAFAVLAIFQYTTEVL